MHSVTSNTVAESLSYSTTEQKTGGVWIDGKPIYRKVVNFGALLNTANKTVAHNIANIDKIVKMFGNSVYVFASQGVLITVLDIPSRLLGR